MGMFDDLIPDQGGGDGKISFDDLVPDKPVRMMEEPNWIERQLAKVDLPAWMDNLRGSAVYGAARGMGKPVVGAVQLAANVLPDSTGIPAAVNKRIADEDKQYELAREARGREGFDAADFVGQVLSPTNAVIAAKAPLAATTMGRVGQGALIGGGAGAMEPVTDAKNYWGKKGAQVATGATVGAVLSPVLGAVGDKAARLLMRENPQAAAARSSMQTDAAINEALKDLGQTIHDIPPGQMEALRAKVAAALEQGQQVDAAALARKADFEALDMLPLKGQITRDPMQFAREQNLRGVENVGEPILARLQDQGTKLQARMGGLAGDAKDAFNAGTQISASLKGTDDVLRNHVTKLYQEARQSAGKDLDVPLQGLATDYADVLRRFGDRIPPGVRNAFEDLGLLTGQQKRVFNFEEADNVLKTINSNMSNDPGVNNALGELRGALRRTLESVDASGGPFAPAVRAAAERFKMHDAIPALKAAADGSVAPDDFVRRFIVNGKTNDVKGMAGVLKQSDPAAFQEARAQIADELRRAAFGENVTGDAPFAAARYMATIRRLGPDKLGAFFNAQEVADILRVGRVGSYIKQAPNASAVNTSNTAGAVANLLARLPGVSPAVGVANKLAGALKNQSAVRSSLAADVPSTNVPLGEGQRNFLAYLLALGAAEGGGLWAGAVGK